MSELFNILEQVKKKIKLFGNEKIAYKMMRGDVIKKEDVNDLANFFQKCTDRKDIEYAITNISQNIVEEALLKQKNAFPIMTYIFLYKCKPWPEAEHIILDDNVYALYYEVWKEKYYKEKHQDDYNMQLKNKYKR